MRKIILYTLVLIILVQIAFSQGFGNCQFGNYTFGNCNVTDERGDSTPKIPFVIGITVLYNDEPLNHTLTRIENLNTRESSEGFTNENGEYVFGLANFKTRYLEGDILKISVCINDDRCNEKSKDYTVSDKGGIKALFRLFSEQTDVIAPSTESKGGEFHIPRPDEYIPPIIYIDNSSIISINEYYDSNVINQYINQTNNNYIDKSVNIWIKIWILIKVKIKLIIGFTIGIFITGYLVLFLRKRVRKEKK